jgi:hypothetical protein
LARRPSPARPSLLLRSPHAPPCASGHHGWCAWPHRRAWPQRHWVARATEASRDTAMRCRGHGRPAHRCPTLHGRRLAVAGDGLPATRGCPTGTGMGTIFCPRARWRAGTDWGRGYVGKRVNLVPALTWPVAIPTHAHSLLRWRGWYVTSAFILHVIFRIYLPSTQVLLFLPLPQ